ASTATAPSSPPAPAAPAARAAPPDRAAPRWAAAAEATTAAPSIPAAVPAAAARPAAARARRSGPRWLSRRRSWPARAGAGTGTDDEQGELFSSGRPAGVLAAADRLEIVLAHARHAAFQVGGQRGRRLLQRAGQRLQVLGAEDLLGAIADQA